MLGTTPLEQTQGFEKPEPKVGRTPGEDVTWNIGIEAASLLGEYGEESLPGFSSVVSPVGEGYEKLWLRGQEIEADPKSTEEGKAEARAVEAKPYVEVIVRAEEVKRRYEEEIAATDASLIKCGEIQPTIPQKEWDELTNRISSSLKERDADPVKRDLAYLSSCEKLGNSANMDLREKTLVFATIAVLENRVVFNDRTQEVEPFVSSELVNEQRLKRGRFQKVEATRKRDRKQRLASAIGSVTSLARQRVEKFAPGVASGKVKVL